MYNLLYEACPWHSRVALFDGEGKLLMLRVDDASRPYISGSVVLGRVRKVNLGLDAAFIDIGDVVDGFLPLRTLPKEIEKLNEGQALPVRVTRGWVGSKGARLDARVATKMPDPLPQAPALIKRAPSSLLRGLQDAGDNAVKVWLVNGTHRATVLEHIPEEHLYQLNEHPDVELIESLEEELERLQTLQYPLAGGGQLLVDHTNALTSIDVDAGAFSGKNREQAMLTMNLFAAEEIVRLCRALDLGGSIIVDFISLRSKRDRNQVVKHLEALFAQVDARTVEVLPMSRFGLVEINRERGGMPLSELLQQPAFIAGRIGLELWRQSYGHTANSVRVHPEVAIILKQQLTAEVSQAGLGKAVAVEADPSLRLDQYRFN